MEFMKIYFLVRQQAKKIKFILCIYTIKIRIPSEVKVNDTANIPLNSIEISQKPQINTDKFLINNDRESRRGRTINLDDLKIQNKEIYDKCTDFIILI